MGSQMCVIVTLKETTLRHVGCVWLEWNVGLKDSIMTSAFLKGSRITLLALTPGELREVMEAKCKCKEIENNLKEWFPCL